MTIINAQTIQILSGSNFAQALAEGKVITAKLEIKTGLSKTVYCLFRQSELDSVKIFENIQTAFERNFKTEPNTDKGQLIRNLIAMKDKFSHNAEKAPAIQAAYKAIIKALDEKFPAPKSIPAPASSKTRSSSPTHLPAPTQTQILVPATFPRASANPTHVAPSRQGNVAVDSSPTKPVSNPMPEASGSQPHVRSSKKKKGNPKLANLFGPLPRGGLDPAALKETRRQPAEHGDGRTVFVRPEATK